MNKKVTCIFPAFGSELLGCEEEIISRYPDVSKNFLNEASEFLGKDLLNSGYGESYNKNELNSQYFTYILSCIISQILKNKISPSKYTAGYSMGIYSVLFFSDSITFIDGLKIIKKAYELILNATNGDAYSLGSIVGLEEKDLAGIISKSGTE